MTRALSRKDIARLQKEIERIGAEIKTAAQLERDSLPSFDASARDARRLEAAYRSLRTAQNFLGQYKDKSTL
jgi:hypothetical protein